MPEPAVVLDPGQAEDLYQLLDHAETLAQWLLHAAEGILDDLAQAAYPAHFQPRSAVFWLIENLVHTQHRLHKTLIDGGVDTSAPIGNQIRSGLLEQQQVKGLIAGHGGQVFDHLSLVRHRVLPSSGGSGCYCLRVIGTHAGTDPGWREHGREVAAGLSRAGLAVHFRVRGRVASCCRGRGMATRGCAGR